MTPRLPNVALIGCGQWGRNLARNLANLSVLRMVCDPNPVVLEGVRVLYPGVLTSQDPEAALTNPEIDACVIVSTLAQRVRTGVSVGENAVLVLKAR